MDYLCQELNIPRKQISETTTKNRFKCIANKNFLKTLIKHKKLGSFPVYPHPIDEWPAQKDIGSNWVQVFVVVRTIEGIEAIRHFPAYFPSFQAYKKCNQKVIPLPKCKNDVNDHELPLTYSQMLYYIQQTNYKSLWKSAYKKYSRDDLIDSKATSSSKTTENLSGNLIPHELVLREAIMRMYGCSIIHYKLDKVTDDSQAMQFDLESQNVNHYPFMAAIESTTHFYLFYHPIIEHSLHDCITYSPAILDKTFNKPLFIIYQLLNLLKAVHEKGLLLGDIGSNDIYLNENLLIRVIPKLESNLIQFEETLNEALETETTMPLMSNPQFSLKNYCQMWCTGQISNFDYLTLLNNFAGRRIDSADYHHIVPWVIDFTSKNGNWRDLTKTKYRLTKGDAQLDLTYQHIKHGGENTTPHHVSDVLSEITFYVYMARKTPKSVLCRHVRAKFVAAEYPASIKRLQEWTPDGET
jgi:WD repeat-containing protein 81